MKKETKENLGKDIILSVVVLNYNNELFVRDCLSSIERQGLENYEVIIIDDCSTDNSIRVIEEYIRHRPQFTLIKKEKNTGGAASSTLGIGKSRGKYLALVDSDDIVADHAYRHLIERMEKDESDFAAGLPLRLFDGLVYACPSKTSQLTLFAENRIIETDEEKGDYCNMAFYWNCVYRMSFIKDNNISMPEGLLLADRILLYSAIYKAKKISIDHHVVYFWRRNTRDNKKSITDQRKDDGMIADRCDSFQAQVDVTLENAEPARLLLTKSIWENSIDRLFFPLSDILKDEELDEEYFFKICDRYRELLIENKAFFLHLLNIGNFQKKDTFFLSCLLSGKDRLLIEQANNQGLEQLDERAERKNRIIITKASTKRNHIFLHVRESSQVTDKAGRQIKKILAITRYYGHQVYELEYDSKKRRFDVAGLPRTTYNFIAVGHQNARPFMEECIQSINTKKIYEKGLLKLKEEDYLLLGAKSGKNPVSVLQKRRYTLVNKEEKDGIYIRVNDGTIGLLIYNTTTNKKTFLHEEESRLFYLDYCNLECGRNVLLDQIQKGVYSVVYKAQLTNNKQELMGVKQLFSKKRLEIII